MDAERYPLTARLERGQIIADTGRDGPSEDTPAVDRICWIDLDDNAVGLFELTKPDALPRVEPLEEIEGGLRDGTLRVLEADPWLAPIIVSLDSDTPEKRRQDDVRRKRAEMRYQTIMPLVEEHERELFDPRSRGPLVAELERSRLMTKPTAFARIRRWFRHGMVENALLTEHDACGAPGIPRKPRDVKRGRKYKRKNRPGDKPGVNIDDHLRKLLQDGWKKYRQRKKQRISAAYRSTLDLYFATGYRLNAGELVPVLPPSEELPTVGQFRYWGEKLEGKRCTAALRHGLRKYHLEHRELGGSARDGVSGPADTYQVDATGGLVHLVERRSRAVRIGKAVVYAVCDVYSQLVLGWVVALEHASYAAMAMALERAFTDKVAYCRNIGIDIEWEDWPAAIICRKLLGDRGPELMGHQSDNAVSALRFDFDDTPPGRADWKAYVERLFGGAKDGMRDVPGATRGPPQRAEPNAADDACLTLDDLEELLIRYFLSFNHSHEVGDHPDDIYLQAEDLACTPINLWNWGRRNRAGAGKRFDREHIRAALMPKARVPATGEGLMFRDRAYGSATLSEQGAFLRGTGHKRVRYVVAYDPRNLDEVWLVDKRGRLLERCPLQPKYAHLQGRSLWEDEEIRAAGATRKMSAQHGRLKHQIGFDKAKERIVSDARTAQAPLGIEKAEYDDEARRREQSQRRSETAWTGGAGGTDAPDSADSPYVAPPDYGDALEDTEGA